MHNETYPDKIIQLTEEEHLKLFAKVKPIYDGVSPDKKYYVKTREGEKFFLRVYESFKFSGKQLEFKFMQQLTDLGVSSSEPIEIGVYANEKTGYTLTKWIDNGTLLHAFFPSCSVMYKYFLGRQFGESVRKMHSASPTIIEPYKSCFELYEEIAKDSANMSKLYPDMAQRVSNMHLTIEHYKHLLDPRPQKIIHGDLALGNLIFENGVLHFIDFVRVSLHDPWYELAYLAYNFTKRGKSYQTFYNGMLHSYFNGEPPTEFWHLLTLYTAIFAMQKAVAPSKIQSTAAIPFIKLFDDCLNLLNDDANLIPKWYCTEKTMRARVFKVNLKMPKKIMSTIWRAFIAYKNIGISGILNKFFRK